jgi:hypothetical protein
MFFAQAEARFFLTPNTKLAGNVGIFHGAPFGSTAETVATLAWGAEIEYKFGMHPISIFARYEALSYNDDSNSTGSSSTIVGGIKLHFGVGTLLDQDRGGATLKVMQDLTPATWNRVNDQG